MSTDRQKMLQAEREKKPSEARKVEALEAIAESLQLVASQLTLTNTKLDHILRAIGDKKT